jgi:repressor LexA
VIDAAICDGDIVTVRRRDSADHGDIVASSGGQPSCGVIR